MNPTTPADSATPASSADIQHPTKSVRSQKRKKASHTPDINTDRTSRCFLGQVPLEVLAEVLGYTSPRDILAVARTSKYFCATLVNNTVTDTKYIWKRARKAFVPEIPEPLPNFTEASYAAFLFDKGECEACGKRCRNKYASFALRLRLCDKPACKRSWMDTKAVQPIGYEVDRYVSILTWIPRIEYHDMGLPVVELHQPHIYRVASTTLRMSDWKRAIDEYNKAALSDSTLVQYIASKSKAASRYSKFAEHCKALVKWRNADFVATKQVQQANLEFSKQRATSQEWKLWDLIQSSKYGMLYRTKNICKERIKPSDFDSILPTIEEEIFNLNGARKNREDEQSYRQRRDDVESHYHRIKGTNKRTAMPSLAEFRHLPMVQRQLFKSANAPSTKVAHELKHSKLVGELIEEDLDRWVEAARTSLAAVLGFPTWKNASVHKLHPVDRLTARFRCNKCDARGEPKKWDGGCLTFAEACAHRCKPGGKTRAKERWQAAAFVPDDKAIGAIQQILTFFEHGAEHVKSIDEARALGPRISCMLCTAQIAMDFDVLVRHCHRHEKTEFRVATESEIKTLAPFEPGLCATLAVHSNTAEKKRKELVYHCRHCAYPRSRAAQDPEHMASTTAVADPGESRDVPSGAVPGKKKLKGYGFDGLRSHVKEKHGIQWIGDEDFYRAN